MATRVTARCTRSASGMWAVEVPEVPGLFTQARQLAQVPGMVKDAAQLLGEDVDPRLEVVLPPEAQARLDKAKAEARAAEEAQRLAAELSRSVVRMLRTDGLSVRDIGMVLGVSPQRVSQLASA